MAGYVTVSVVVTVGHSVVSTVHTSLANKVCKETYKKASYTKLKPFKQSR